jgi:lactoylglutathione lyase
MKYLHSMVRVRDLDASLRFYCEGLGLREARRKEVPQGKYTLVFLSAPESPESEIELTHNWGSTEDYGSARNFGHLAFRVDDIYATCEHPFEDGRHDQPPAARRTHGIRALAGSDLDRALAEGRIAAAERAVAIDAEYRRVVTLRISRASRAGSGTHYRRARGIRGDGPAVRSPLP